MSMIVTERSETARTPLRMPVIDMDVHPTTPFMSPWYQAALPRRWADYINTYGLGVLAIEYTIPPQREFTHRLDSLDKNGLPASDPVFSRAQLLDEYDMSGAVLSDVGAMIVSGGGNNFPEQLGFAMARAYNDVHRDLWLRDDPRWYTTINIPLEYPDEAVKEINRVRSGAFGERFAAVQLEPRGQMPLGNPKYWPIYQAAVEHDIPLHFHTSPGRRMTGSGPANTYFEWHSGIALRNFTLATSMVFEGVFERFPTLKVALIEMGWSWAVPTAWRMDRAWSMLKDEVSHLQRKPSEYLAEHFFFATQPREEPEHLEDYFGLQEQFESVFGTDHLMFSTDYPHWDFDSPYDSVPQDLPLDTRRKIFGETASKLFKIPLIPNSGLAFEQ